MKDLVDLKHSPESDSAKTFLSSKLAYMKNNYYNFCKFFCSWLGFTQKQGLNAERDSFVFNQDTKEKRTEYGEDAKVWKDISKRGLKSIGQPNHEINLTLGMCPFLLKSQDTINKHYRDSHATGWNYLNKMGAVIDDGKHHLNHKIDSDNLCLDRHIRDNRLGLARYDSTLNSSNMIARSGCKKSDDNSTKATKKVITGLFSLANNELNISFRKYVWIETIGFGTQLL